MRFLHTGMTIAACVQSVDVIVRAHRHFRCDEIFRRKEQFARPFTLHLDIRMRFVRFFPRYNFRALEIAHLLDAFYKRNYILS